MRCQKCGGNIIREWGEAKCLQCSFPASGPLPVPSVGNFRCGHPATQENTIIEQYTRTTHERCRTCTAEAQRKAKTGRHTKKGEPIHLFGKTPIAELEIKLVRRR